MLSRSDWADPDWIAANSYFEYRHDSKKSIIKAKLGQLGTPPKACAVSAATSAARVMNMPPSFQSDTARQSAADLAVQSTSNALNKTVPARMSLCDQNTAAAGRPPCRRRPSARRRSWNWRGRYACRLASPRRCGVFRELDKRQRVTGMGQDRVGQQISKAKRAM